MPVVLLERVLLQIIGVNANMFSGYTLNKSPSHSWRRDMTDNHKMPNGTEIRIVQEYDNEFLFDYDPGAECVILRVGDYFYSICRIPEKKTTPEMWLKLCELPGQLNNNRDVSGLIEGGKQIVRGFLGLGAT